MSYTEAFGAASDIGALTETFIGTGAATERIAFEVSPETGTSPFAGFGQMDSTEIADATVSFDNNNGASSFDAA